MGPTLAVMILLVGSLEATVTGREQCKVKEDCDMEGSTCREGTCVCSPGSAPTSDMTRCLPGAEGYGGKCEDTTQCCQALGTGGACYQGRCTCQPGFHYLRGACWRTSNLGDHCNRDENCWVDYDFQSSVCESRICVCAPHYYLREYSSCRRISAPDGECGIKLDCQYPGGDCVNRKCVSSNTSTTPIPPTPAPKLLKANENTHIVLPLPYSLQVGENCTTNSDCKGGPGVECSPRGTCDCRPGYYTDTNETNCYPEIGSPCTRDTDCKGRYTECRADKGWCACKEGYVVHDGNRYCDKQSREIGWSCLDDRWCSLLGPAGVCINKRCTCNSTSHYLQDKLYCWVTRQLGAKCKTNFDCGEGAVCSESKVCDCPSGFHPSGNSTCRRDTPAPGGDCKSDADCVYAHSKCTDLSYCSCEAHYIEARASQEPYCRPGIGGNCTQGGECTAKGSRCERGKCACPDGFIGSSDYSRCLAVASKHNDSCEEDQQCYEVLGKGEGECLRGKCECVRGRHYVTGFSCFPNRILGESCSRKDECTVPGSVCLKGICSCRQGNPVTNTTCPLGEGRGTGVRIAPWFLAVTSASLVTLIASY